MDTMLDNVLDYVRQEALSQHYTILFLGVVSNVPGTDGSMMHEVSGWTQEHRWATVVAVRLEYTDDNLKIASAIAVALAQRDHAVYQGRTW